MIAIFAQQHRLPASTYTNTSYDPTDNILKFRIRNTFRSDIQFDYKKVFAGFSVRYNSDRSRARP